MFHYRRYKAYTVSVTKCRGGFPVSRDPPGDLSEEGSMTGITLSDRETGKSVTISASTLEQLTGRRTSPAPERTCSPTRCNQSDRIPAGQLVAGLSSRTSPPVSPSAVSPDLITSDQYAEAYLHRLFSANGPVAELQDYFVRAGEKSRTPARAALESEEEAGPRGGEKRVAGGEGGGGAAAVEGGDSLKLSIVETQPLDSLDHEAQAVSSTTQL